MKIATAGTTVKVIYTICLQNGTRLRPLHSGDTLEFKLGAGTVLPGFERAVLGMAQGETRRVQVPSADAYGPHRPDKIFTVGRSEVLPRVESLSVGDVVRVASREDGEFFAIVRDMSSDGILLDANHPLCGQDITFEIHILTVSAPEPDSPSALAGGGATPCRSGALHAAGQASQT
jgi:peptidylprolyl isomerase